MELKPIAYIENDFTGNFGIPRQSGLARTTARIVFEPAYRNPDALRGIEAFSHLWLIWEFTEIEKPAEGWHATVRPPRLGGNTRVGVFATRSPYRPNPIGLSSVELLKVDYDCPDGPVLLVKGADLKNGTPVYDIKPYLCYADSHADAKGGFADAHANDRLAVRISDAVREQAKRLGMRDEQLDALSEILSLDPRPAYQNDPGREYGMSYGCFEVAFFVAEEGVTVSSIRPRSL